MSCSIWILIILITLFAIRKALWNRGEVTFAGKTVLITGASCGIGEALTKEISLLGAKKIIIAARRMNELERVK